ncbi:MAG TPA: hypothetical protein PLC38_06180 [Methanobacterium sp.]|nr:hypothetical protein [Methanobacterium sp.]
MDVDDLLSPRKRKKKIDEKEKKKAKKDIEGERSSFLSFKNKKSRKKKEEP